MSYDNIFDVAALMTDVCIAESSYARECDVQLTVSERVRFKHDANFSQRLALCLMDAQTKSWDNRIPAVLFVTRQNIKHCSTESALGSHTVGAEW